MQRHFLRLAAALSLLALALPSGVVAAERHHQTTPLTVVLDPGHGGADIGAADPSQTAVEKILTLQVAARTAADLRALGYRVYLTRSRDQGANMPPRDLNHDGKVDRVDEYDARTLFANRSHGDVFVSIHFDASADPSIHGTHGYYCPARPFWRKSSQLANSLTGSVATSLQRAGYADSNNGVETDVADVVPQAYADYPWFFVLGPSSRRRITGTDMPGALIETLYLTSPRDVAALRRPAIVKALAQGYANGIRAYFGGHTRR
jgi:N-acetylmuramoyl-L-alanine amidase